MYNVEAILLPGFVLSGNCNTGPINSSVAVTSTFCFDGEILMGAEGVEDEAVEAEGVEDDAMEAEGVRTGGMGATAAVGEGVRCSGEADGEDEKRRAVQERRTNSQHN